MIDQKLTDKIRRTATRLNEMDARLRTEGGAERAREYADAITAHRSVLDELLEARARELEQ